LIFHKFENLSLFLIIRGVLSNSKEKIMGFFSSLFGPSQQEIWAQLCDEMGFQFVDGGTWKPDAVVVKFKNWTIILDTFSVSTKNSRTYFTRIRAPFVNKGLKFKIYRKGFFSSIGKLLGMQDLEIGIPEFDEAFIIKGNDPQKITELITDPKMLELIEMQREISLEVRNDEGWFGAKFPEGVDELYFQTVGIIKDKEVLKSLLDLFAQTLNQMCVIGTATEGDPNVNLR